VIASLLTTSLQPLPVVLVPPKDVVAAIGISDDDDDDEELRLDGGK